jgi:hypothetical protein
MATTITSVLAAAAVAAGGLLAPGSDGSAPGRSALVIDAVTARDGRELVDPRLSASGAEVRLPRTASEAITNVRYFAAQGYRVVVAGPLATDAARESGVPAQRATGLSGALTAVAG